MSALQELIDLFDHHSLSGLGIKAGVEMEDKPEDKIVDKVVEREKDSA